MKKNILLGALFSFFELGWYTGNIYSASSAAEKENRRNRTKYQASLSALDNSEKILFSEIPDYYPLLIPHDYH